MSDRGASEASVLELETEAPSSLKSTPDAPIASKTKVPKVARRILPVWARPPWPEWSDDAINREVWEENESVEIFEDPAGEVSPASLMPSNWIRPSELFVEPPKLIDWTVSTIDLITPNAHLCERSEAIRFILSEISELYDYGIANEFLVEGEGTTFKPNSERQGISWKPWDHIYSCCKAGVSGDRPLFNNMGKYYVRLYFMGSWRRITVDDRIPLLQSGRIGLPITNKNELWPMILTKALLKIASLTWTDETITEEICKFSSISALTGWVHEWIDVRESVPSENLWNELTDVLPKYKRPAVADRGDHGKETKKAEEGDDAEGLWWLPNGSGDKEEDADYQDYSDSDKVVTEPIVNEDEVLPTATHHEEHSHKSKKKIKRKPRKSHSHVHHSHGHGHSKVKKETGALTENISPVASELEFETLKEEEPQTKDVKRSKKKGKKDIADSHDTSTDKQHSEVPKIETKKKGKKDASDSHDAAAEKKHSTGTAKVHSKKKGKKDVLDSHDASTDKKHSTGAGKKHSKRKSKKDDSHSHDSTEKKLSTISKEGRNSTSLDKKEAVKKRSKKASVEEHLRDENAKDLINQEVENSIDDPNHISEKNEEKVNSKEDSKDKLGKSKHGKKGKEKHNKEHDKKLKLKSKKASDAGRKSNLKGKKPSDAHAAETVEQETGIDEKVHGDTKNSQLSADFNPAEFKAALMNKLAKRAQTKRDEIGDTDRFKHRSTDSPQGHLKVPRMQDILQGVKKYTGMEHQSLLSTWEAVCGKNVPVALTVVLKVFPKSEEDETLVVPSFLYHPIQLIELRDVPLFKESDRPDTPLWKTFRWKAWAMKKGIIPMEKPLSPDAVRNIKIRTPFVLKIDWYDSGMGIRIVRREYIGEFGGEGYELEEMLDVNPMTNLELTPPPVPPTTSVTLDEACGGGAMEDTGSIATNTDLHKQSIKSSMNADSLKLNFEKSKTLVSSATKITTKLGKNRKGSLANAISGSTEEMLIRGSSKEVDAIAVEEEWLGEDGEMVVFTDFKTSTHDVDEPAEVLPTMASKTLWFHLDSLASSIRKFCKFYSTRTPFGSCFILCRNADLVYSQPGTTNSETIDPVSALPRDITDYHSVPDSQNLTIKFDTLKTLSVTAFHLDQSEGIDSAFYLFSDCWTQQEIMISIEVLQDLVIKKFTDRALNQEAEKSTSKKRQKNVLLNLTFVLEPWDWRNDCCMEAPLIYTSTNSTWATHLTLPAGRNTFRIWLVEELVKNIGSSWQRVRKKLNVNGKSGIVPFVIKFTSKTPIHVGSREEIQNYMTNEPVLFLKQCERLAQNVWTMFLLFGKTRFTYAKNLKSLRKSYCPSYTEPNIINKRLKEVHGTFEDYFVSKIVEMNQGKVDRLMLTALRCLFLNPSLGNGYASPKAFKSKNEKKELELLLRFYRKQKKYPLVNLAVLVIQKYCRGWLVRRLFQIRMKGHKMYPRIEFHIRKIALLLAKNSDSAFSNASDTNLTNTSRINEKLPPEANITPNPPKWAVDILKHLLRVHPLLISVHPHAYCIPHHIKIREIQGVLPSLLNQSSWLPFLRKLFFVPGESKWCYCMIDLQVHPSDGVVLKIINNDTQKCLLTATNQIFLGLLRSNKLGYTMMCYRWAHASNGNVGTGRPPSNQWKIRIITPSIQESLVFKSEQLSFGGQISRKLSLRRLTGYYLPNKDFSICRYTMETPEVSTHLSIRFRTNYEHVKVRLQIWDLTAKTLVLEHTSTGGFLLPAVLMENKSVEANASKSNAEIQSATIGVRRSSDFATTRPLTEPAIPNDSGIIQRYAISVFVIDNSWPLTDRQWIFVHHKRRQFFKKLRKWSFKNFRKSYKTQIEEVTVPQEKSEISPATDEGLREDEQLDDKSKGKKHRKHKATGLDTQITQISNKRESKSESSPKLETQVPLKSKSNHGPKPSSVASKKGKKDESLLPKNSNNHKTSKSDTKSPDILVEQESVANLNILNKPIPCKQKTVKKDHTHHIKKQISSNLTVKSGGRHSQKVHHESQPSWLLEIVTDAGKKYKFINSREKFKQQLRETKKQWESKGTDRLAKGLASRRNYLLRHLVPVNYKSSNPFGFVNPMANFYSCLHLEKYDLDGYKEKKFIKCLKQGWRKLKEQRKTIMLKHSDKVNKINEAKIAGKRVTKIDRRFKRKENGILLKRLKRLPRVLGKRKEQWLKMKREMEETTKQDPEASEMDQFGPEFNDNTSFRGPSDITSIGNVTDKQVKTSKTKAKRRTGLGTAINPHTDDSSFKNGESDAPSGRKKKGKKDKTDNEKKSDVGEADKSNKPKTPNKKSFGARSIIGETDKKRKSNITNAESKKAKVAGVKRSPTDPKLSDKLEKIDAESQTGGKDKRNRTAIVKIKRSKTIRDGLLTAQQLHPTSGTSQVRIIRSGGDKYCQLKTDKVPVTKQNTQVADTSIGDRLLNWAFNYNCMKKEPAEEDPTCGTCGDEAKIAIQKKGSAELNNLIEQRYAMPPPKRPTHVLIGPKISKCGLDPKKEQLKRLEGDIPWSLRDKQEERIAREENLMAWQNTHEEMQTVFQNFKVGQQEEKNKYVELIYNAAIERGKKNREEMNTVRNSYVRPTTNDDLPSVSGSSDSFDSSDDCEAAPQASQRAIPNGQLNLTHDSTSKIEIEYETDDSGDTENDESGGTCSDWDEDDDYINYLQLAMASQSFDDLEEINDIGWENIEEHHEKRLSSLRPHRLSQKTSSSVETEPDADMEINSKSEGSGEGSLLDEGEIEDTEDEL